MRNNLSSIKSLINNWVLQRGSQENYYGNSCYDGETYSWTFGLHPMILSRTDKGWDFEHLYFPKVEYKYEILIPDGWTLFVGGNEKVKTMMNGKWKKYFNEQYLHNPMKRAPCSDSKEPIAPMK